MIETSQGQVVAATRLHEECKRALETNRVKNEKAWRAIGERTIQRAELTAFWCFLRKANGPTNVRVDNKGIFDGLWRSEMKCIGPKGKDADLWILMWEEFRRVHQEGTLVVVEHAIAHRSKKEIQQTSLLEKFIIEGNEKADGYGAGVS